MYIAALWIGMAASLLPRKWLRARRLRKATAKIGRHVVTGRSGEFRSYDEWTPAGSRGSVAHDPATDSDPAGHNADVPAAAAETAGGRNSDQSVGN